MFVTGKLKAHVKTRNDLVSNGFSLSGCFQRVLTQVFQHHNEFISAQTSHRIAVTHTGDQALGNLLQQNVSNIVAEGIVERLEIVQIDI